MILLGIDVNGTEHTTVGADIVHELVDARARSMEATVRTTVVAEVLQHLLIISLLVIGHGCPFLRTELSTEDSVIVQIDVHVDRNTLRLAVEIDLSHTTLAGDGTEAEAYLPLAFVRHGRKAELEVVVPFEVELITLVRPEVPVRTTVNEVAATATEFHGQDNPVGSNSSYRS